VKLRTLLFIAIVALCTIKVQAQKGKAPEEAKWIKMMDDPNVNYFEAVKNYEAFWKGKPKPLDEHEVISEAETRSHAKPDEKSKRELKKEAKERAIRLTYQKYAYDCKRFEHWMLVTKPYVQADGHILSKAEQLKIWQDQRH
jgi:hypothetical protein